VIALLFVPILMGVALIVGGATSDNPTMINIGCGLGGVALVVFFIIKVREMSRAEAERKQIWKTGKPATARVVKITEVGGDDQPEVDLDLEVRSDGAPETPVKVRSLISRLAIPRIQPGCEIQVRVDPSDAKKIVLDPALTPYRMD
jgi:hypothetical protein